MSALSLAQTTLTSKVDPKFLEVLAENWSGKVYTADDLKTDEALMGFIGSSGKKTKKTQKNSSPKKSPQERAMDKPDEDKCQARTWGGGYGAQCIKAKSEGCLCKMHQGKAEGND